MKIVYSKHLKRRIKERGFPENYPKKIYENAKIRLYDTLTGHYIAISKLKYAGKLRNLAISYDIMRETVEIITSHPISEEGVQARIKSGRWKKNENEKE